MELRSRTCTLPLESEPASSPLLLVYHRSATRSDASRRSRFWFLFTFLFCFLLPLLRYPSSRFVSYASFNQSASSSHFLGRGMPNRKLASPPETEGSR